jgi:hypothetical protein
MGSLLSTSMMAAAALAAFGCSTFILLRQRRSRLAAALPVTGRGRFAALDRPRIVPLERRPAAAAGQPSEIARVSGLTMREAEDWLDWLEQHGYNERSLVCEEDKFAVEYRVDAGHKPGPPHTARTETTGELKATC